MPIVQTSRAGAPPAPPSSTPGALRLAARQLRRDLRAGELRLLVFAVLLAVAALSAVGFFADRIDAGLARDARQLLGGDAVLVADEAPLAADTAAARRHGLATARTAIFSSMARADDARGGASRLVSVKAVDANYPLRGRVVLAVPEVAAVPAVHETPAVPAGNRSAEAPKAPAPGQVWVDPALLGALNLAVGDALSLGDAQLRIAAAIDSEPDRGSGFAAFAPRVLMNDADLAATHLIQPASRVTWRLAVASPRDDDRAVQRWVAETERAIQTGARRGVRIETLATGRPEMRQTLDRASKFLNLVALLSALLAAVAVGIATRDFANRHLDECAMLRVLGLPQRTIAAQYAIEFLAAGLLASAGGVALGYAVHLVFVQLLAGLVATSLPAPSFVPALFGLGVGLALLAGFGLPPVLQLAQVPALRVLRRDLGSLRPASALVLGAGLAGFAALLFGVARDARLGAIAVGGFAAAVAVFALLSWGVVVVLRRVVPRSRPPRWLLLATRQIAARPAFAVLQVSALAVGLLALVLLVLLRTDLIASWRAATPDDAPNRFVINVQPDQADAFRARLAAGHVARYDWYPMIRGRLVAINGRAVQPDAYADDRARRLVDREFNLSHAAAMPAHNSVVAGRWQPEERDALSVESGLAETLGLKLGDRLRFDLGGQAVEGRITSLREVDWSSMRVNFFVMFPTATLADVPLSYIAAFRAPGDARTASAFDNALAREFPNLTEIDVSAMIAQVQRVLDQVVRAVEFLFGFTLAAGLVVLFAAITATRESRAREFAVMRALGAGARLLAQVQRAELLGVGALAGVLATGAALVIGWAIARWVFEFEWNAPLWAPLAGGLAGALLALGAGWWGLREVLRRPVVETLREAGRE